MLLGLFFLTQIFSFWQGFCALIFGQFGIYFSERCINNSIQFLFLVACQFFQGW